MKRLLLTVCHYRNTDEVVRFCEQVDNMPTPAGWAVSIAVTDNSDSLTEELGSHVALFKPGANLGYIGGCAYGLQSWLSNTGCHADMVGILNTDLVFDADAWHALLLPDYSDDVGVVAPAIELPDGTSQNPFARSRMKPTRILLLRTVFRHRQLTRAWFLLHGLKRRIRRRTSVQTSRGGETPIYAGHGAAMFLRPPFFERGGQAEFPAFMFGEELHIAEQALRLRLKILYMPNCRVIHHEHAVIGEVPSEQSRRWRAESLDFLWREYFGPFARPLPPETV